VSAEQPPRLQQQLAAIESGSPSTEINLTHGHHSGQIQKTKYRREKDKRTRCLQSTTNKTIKSKPDQEKKNKQANTDRVAHFTSTRKKKTNEKESEI